MNKKLLVPLLLVLITPIPLVSQPITILLWDNDMGARFIDPDVLEPTAQDSIGCEIKLLKILTSLGYQVVVSDSLQPLDIFDAVFITNGWKDLAHSQMPGIIDPAQRLVLKGYMAAGHPVFMDGNDIAFTYMGTPQSPNYDPDFMIRYFGTQLEADQTQLPVDSLHGVPGSLFQSFHYKYGPFTPSGAGPLSSVDLIWPNSTYGQAQPIFYSTPENKWAYCRATSYASSEKDAPHKAILLSFVFSACRNNPMAKASSKQDMMRQVMRFFSHSGNSFYPAPPQNLTLTVGNGRFTLSWPPHPDPKVVGYQIMRSVNDSLNFSPLALVPVPLDTFVDTSITIGRTYWYFLRAFTPDGDTSRGSEKVNALAVGISQPPGPDRFNKKILQASCHGTEITYILSQPAMVKIELYDLLGQKISSNWGRSSAGEHTYSFDNIGTGFYIVRLQAADERKTLKMLVIK